uniref:RRM domain-containing protein n=1 Tax=Ciona intestinalis TaxID=7719 RepID=F6RZE8_CIOIN
YSKAGKKGKKKAKNTKTLSLNDFLGDTPGASPGVIKPTLDWADEADQENNSNKNKLIQLPTAPRSSRSVEIDTSRIPDSGPYTAYVGNLPYDADEFVLQEFFKDIPMTNVRLQEENGRFRGYGYVQFPDKQSLIQALQMNDETLQKRVIRVDIADNQNKGSTEGKGRGDRYGSLSGDPDRLEGNWRRTSNDHLNGGPVISLDEKFNYNSTLYLISSSAVNNHGDISDAERPFVVDRYGGGRDGRYESSFSRGGESEQWMQRREPPKERPRLNLKPREKPLNPEAATTRNETCIFGQLQKSQNIFGSAKPVDTAAREREMEQKIAEQEKQ